MVIHVNAIIICILQLFNLLELSKLKFNLVELSKVKLDLVELRKLKKMNNEIKLKYYYNFILFTYQF